METQTPPPLQLAPVPVQSYRPLSVHTGVNLKETVDHAVAFIHSSRSVRVNTNHWGVHLIQHYTKSMSKIPPPKSQPDDVEWITTAVTTLYQHCRARRKWNGVPSRTDQNDVRQGVDWTSDHVKTALLDVKPMEQYSQEKLWLQIQTHFVYDFFH